MIALRAHCLLISSKTPDRLLGLEAHIIAAIHIVGAPSRYTVLLNDGRLLRCNEEALLPINPILWEWERVGLRQVRPE